MAKRTSLDEGRQLALVRWAVKTAMIRQFTGRADDQKYFADADRRTFKETFALPANLWV